jgi:hypothetical protein
MKDWGVDIGMTASQKALGVPPGLAVMVVSQRALVFSLLFTFLASRTQSQVAAHNLLWINEKVGPRHAKVRGWPRLLLCYSTCTAHHVSPHFVDPVCFGKFERR